MSRYYSIKPTNVVNSSSLREEANDAVDLSSAIFTSESCIHHSQTHVSHSLPQSDSLLYNCLKNEQDGINWYRLRQKHNGCSGLSLGVPRTNQRFAEVAGSTPVVELSCIDRPRSQSMVSMIRPDSFRISPSPSGGSSDSLLEDNPSPGKVGNTEEVLVEATCNKFKRLSTREGDSPSDESPVSQFEEQQPPSKSPPGFDYDVVRKFSIGSQLATYKRQLSSHDNYYGELESGVPGLPIDLTCKRKKSDATSTSLDCLSVQANGHPPVSKRDRDFCENFNKDESILKSVLVGMGRKRSHTLSVCGRQNFRISFSNNNIRQETSNGLCFRQRVTLAKRTLGPVTGRVSEYTNKITQMLLSLPELMELPSGDQQSLISDSVHRLLMLYAAEDSLQFVVTAVSDSDISSSGEEGTLVSDGPTRQFTDSVQNFISKCQAMNITCDEYIYMRQIALFHTGSCRVLERMDLIEKANSEGQQRLQVLVQRCYPDDRLRYSKLLLTLYTLFGINGSMLETLLCQHLILSGRSLQEFVYEEFLASC